MLIIIDFDRRIDAVAHRHGFNAAESFCTLMSKAVVMLPSSMYPLGRIIIDQEVAVARFGEAGEFAPAATA